MIRAFAVALVAITPLSISAQSIPRIAVEVAAGSGPHSERSGETWFRDTHGGILRAGASIRLGTIGERVAPVVKIDYNMPGLADKISDCPPAPNGTCRLYFPATDGWSVGAGIMTTAASRTTIGGSVGFFRSKAHRYAALTGSYALTRHFAVLAEWRYLDLEYASGQRVSYRPIQAGVRVY